MIEVILTKYDDNSIHMVTGLIMWFVDTLYNNEEYKKNISFDGYTVVRDDKHSELFILFICANESQKKIMQILQQPPEEYKGRYVARFINMEPEPVQVVEDDDEDDDKSVDKEKT